MGYQRGDYRYGGDDRWRGREPESHRAERGYGRGTRGGWDREQDDDRGFFERAGDEVRSWFGDDEAERQRDRDQSRYERERGYGRSGSDDWGSSNWDRGDDRQRYGRSAYGGGSRGTEAGFGGGRSFDRIDGGSTGRAGSSARDHEIHGGGARSGHDPNYSEWRRRQIDELDRDYDDYRSEHQSKFEQEFGSWRERRQGQRDALRRVTEHMEIVGSDGEHVGTVDKVRGDRILLTRSDPDAGGHHHSIPCSWIDRVEDKAYITKSAEEAHRAWRDEETNRALFERENSGTEGPHALDRSFAGTYRS